MKALFNTEKTPVQTRSEANRLAVVPAVNICETKDGYHLEAEMPGVDKAGLELTLEGHELTISGRPASEPPTGTALFRERREVEFRRVFELDPAVDTARIKARMNQGVLHLYLPKTEAVKPRKIEVGE